MKGTIQFICIGLVTLISLGFQTSSAETLKEAVEEAISTNPNIRSTAFNRLGRDQEVRQAKSGYFPKIDVVFGAGKDFVEKPIDDELSPVEASLSLRQNVFAGLSTQNEVKRQKARVRSQAYLVQSTAENIALSTTQLYLGVLKNEAVFKLAEENLLLHQRISDQIRLRSESGVGSQADMTQIQSRLSLAESNKIVAEQNLADAKTNYLAVIGRMPADLIDPTLDQSKLPVSEQEAETLALDQHPTLKSANSDLDARVSQDKVAKSPFMPAVDIELDSIYEDETNYSEDKRENLLAMIKLRYNLFNGWKDHARKKETAELVNEAREIRNNTQRQVVESMRLSWQAYNATLKRLDYLEKRVEFATATAESYTEQWNIGKRTLLDVLDAEAERIDSQQQFLVAGYDNLYSQYRILNASGQLVHSLDLEWPEEAIIDEKEEEDDKENEDAS